MAGVERNAERRVIDAGEDVLVVLQELNPIAVMIFQRDAYPHRRGERHKFLQRLVERLQWFARAVGSALDNEPAACFGRDLDCALRVVG